MRKSKTVLDSGFHAVYSGFQELDSRFQAVDSGFHAVDSGFQELDSGFHVSETWIRSSFHSRDFGSLELSALRITSPENSGIYKQKFPGSLIPQAKVSRILKSGLP